ncbi:MAG: MobB mobilization protein [Rhodocyclaceae bacterium]|nr:MobB mobilization protein [Rhodocyclaceae bacterium]
MAKENKTERLLLRVTPKELAAMRAKARDAEVSVSEYVRRCCAAPKHSMSNRAINSAHVVNELRRLGGLQKHLFNEGGGVLSREYANILLEIREAIMRIGR